MPAAQHEGAVESVKTAGGTGGADLRGTGAGSPVQVGDSLTGKLRKAMERKMEANDFGHLDAAAFSALQRRWRQRQPLVGGVARFT